MSNPLDPWQEAHRRAPVTMGSDTMTDAMTEIAEQPTRAITIASIIAEVEAEQPAGRHRANTDLVGDRDAITALEAENVRLRAALLSPDYIRITRAEVTEWGRLKNAETRLTAERDRARDVAVHLWDEMERGDQDGTHIAALRTILNAQNLFIARAYTLADTWANTDLGDDYGTHHVTQAQVDAVVAMGEELRAVLDGEG